MTKPTKYYFDISTTSDFISMKGMQNHPVRGLGCMNEATC